MEQGPRPVSPHHGFIWVGIISRTERNGGMERLRLVPDNTRIW